MSDIVERLRLFDWSEALGVGDFSVCTEGADEIERLRDALTKIATSSNQLPGRMFVAFAREVLTQAALQEKGHE
jgi:hypothetical protein